MYDAIVSPSPQAAEAENHLDKAEQYLDSNILKQDPTNMGAWKRKVCLYKEAGDLHSAIVGIRTPVNDPVLVVLFHGVNMSRYFSQS